MKRRQADLAAGLLVGAVLLVGLLFTWDAYAQQRAFESGTGGMMGGDGMMGSMMYTGPDPLWYLLGTLVLAGVLGGSYLLLRSSLQFDDEPAAAPASSVTASEPTAEIADRPAAPGGEMEASDTESAESAVSETGSGGSARSKTESGESAGSETESGESAGSETESGESAGSETGSSGSAGSEATSTESTAGESSRPDILDVLPEDERRVLEPVVDSPGLTQIALRDRSGFSKSKVSQTASELEKRGLIYREKQGRTYRVYPSDELADR